MIYFARFINSIAGLVINPEEHSMFRWFTHKDLEKAANTAKGSNDLEFQAIPKGFALLQG